MGWGPSAMYTIEHKSGLKITDFRISNSLVERANSGNLHCQTKICLQFRHQVERNKDTDPGFVYYDELALTKTRDIPPASKRRAAMKVASATGKHRDASTRLVRR